MVEAAIGTPLPRRLVRERTLVVLDATESGVVLLLESGERVSSGVRAEQLRIRHGMA